MMSTSYNNESGIGGHKNQRAKVAKKEKLGLSVDANGKHSFSRLGAQVGDIGAEERKVSNDGGGLGDVLRRTKIRERSVWEVLREEGGPQ